MQPSAIYPCDITTCDLCICGDCHAGYCTDHDCYTSCNVRTVCTVCNRVDALWYADLHAAFCSLHASWLAELSA